MNQPPLRINSVELPKELNSILTTSASTTVKACTSTLPLSDQVSTFTSQENAAAEGEGEGEGEGEEEIEEITRPKARLVMGPPLGESESTTTTNTNGKDTIIEGEELIENEEILADLPDEAEDLEMTHLRLRTLRGLGLERFKKVQRISLRQNLLSALSYVPLPVESISEQSLVALSSNLSTADQVVDEVDEDSHDDEDAKKKEEEFEHHHLHAEKRGDVIWPLHGMVELEELDLYDNRLKSVKGLEGLVGLTSLDLSFNLIRSVSPFEDQSPSSPYAFPNLTHLYLIQNKLMKIEGVNQRNSLVYLEFGGNRIRTIENLPSSANLRSLFLGKNKITKIQGLEGLTGLKTLSIQSNRLTKIEGLEKLIELEELYLSHNGLTLVEGLDFNTKLTTLDIGNNKITSIPTASILPLILLEELWANDNLLKSLPILPASTHPALNTIYLEGNPVEKGMGTSYRRKIMLEMEQISQIDAVHVRRS